MRRIALVPAAGVALAVCVATVGPAAARTENEDPDRRRHQLGLQSVEKHSPGVAVLSGRDQARGPNPYLALVPDPTKVDWHYWKQAVEAASDRRAAQRRVPQQSRQPLLVDEQEPDGLRGGNDTLGAAQFVPGFGTARGKRPAARILGTLSPEQVTPEQLAPVAEDNGSIPLAGQTGVTAERSAVETTGVIGDGPHGSAGTGSGDFDFYELSDVPAGKQIVARTTVGGGFDSILVLWDADGNPVAANDDAGGGLASRLSVTPAEQGDYYLMVGGFAPLPADPFDSGSGPGAGSEGDYGLTLKVIADDVDSYSMLLRPGDVVGASVTGSAGRLALYDPTGREVQGSSQDLTALYSPQSPLPGGGNGVLSHVATQAGRYVLQVAEGDGNYDVTYEAYRPTLEQERMVQTLFLDFDGERVNTAIFGGPGVRTLSPLSGFLGRWGLPADDKDALIDTVVRTVRENLERDLERRGLADDYRIRIRNSRDHPDPFGRSNVSRVIVGGTVEEAGITTVGVAQSIDVGNFGHEETALVLLDLLSNPAGSTEVSLNNYIEPESDVIDFVGGVIGDLVSHEAGHYFGNWHTDPFNAQPNVMDQGGNIPVFFALGPDGVGGTADDPDLDYGKDRFAPSEGFTGIEDTLNTIAFGLSSRRGAGS